MTQWRFSDADSKHVFRDNADGSTSFRAVGKDEDTTTFLPYIVPPPVIPQEVTPRQFRQALTRAGLRTAVEAFVTTADQDTKDWYEYSTMFMRQNPVLIAAGHGLGKTDADIDALFTLAASLM